MKVTSPQDFSWVSVLARPVEKGETVDVDEDQAERLVAQGWKLAKEPKAAKAENAPVAAQED